MKALVQELAKLRNFHVFNELHRGLSARIVAINLAEPREAELHAHYYLDELEKTAFCIRTGIVDGEAEKWLEDWLSVECADLLKRDDLLGSKFRAVFSVPTSSALAELRAFIEKHSIEVAA